MRKRQLTPSRSHENRSTITGAAPVSLIPQLLPAFNNARRINKSGEEQRFLAWGNVTGRLRAFYRFAHDRQWVENNPATLIKLPKVSIRPTMPLTREEMVQILRL